MAARRVQYDAHFKRSAILIAEEIGNSAAARRLDVAESTICEWRLQREALFKSEPGRKGFLGPRCGHHTELEKNVAEFVIEQRNRLLGVNVELIQWKAGDVAREMGIPRENLKASQWTREDRALTSTGRIKRPSAANIAEWVSAAWYGLLHDMIVRTFKKCCISNYMDGAEDDLIWEEESDKEGSTTGNDGDESDE
ncbi:hypothetical protein HPB52_000251 [Rhipicephalus sanguineus]|uniref:Uncharacterized protein n=1 Tax=Rhipicephalus sanguineus TaxID=34632 RepID=A0A9D4STF3_RHISA|nr:hypothetical protein HPB52_000251 [Rhipicephalus sanguineus]